MYNKKHDFNAYFNCPTNYNTLFLFPDLSKTKRNSLFSAKVAC